MHELAESARQEADSEAVLVSGSILDPKRLKESQEILPLAIIERELHESRFDLELKLKIRHRR
jgi:hypothetical protein